MATAASRGSEKGFGNKVFFNRDRAHGFSLSEPAPWLGRKF